jgi:hypothetical protein
VFLLREPGPFPGGLPPNPACGFHRTGLSRDLCRVRDGVRVDPVVAGSADDERLAPHSCHEGGPRGPSRSRFPERLGRDTTVITIQARSVLYIVACGGRPAGDLPEFVRYAQDHGWDVCVIATPSGIKFLEPGPSRTLPATLSAVITSVPMSLTFSRPRMRSW